MRTKSTYLALLGILLLPTAANATLMRLDFGVMATSGPLTGVIARGYGIFDSSVAPAGGGTVLQTGLFQDFSFTWNGISYDETSANTGGLRFDALGALTNFLLGSNCGAGFCTVSSSSSDITVTGRSFVYGYGRGIGYGVTKWRTTSIAVPEPNTLTLLGLGLFAVGLARRKVRI